MSDQLTNSTSGASRADQRFLPKYRLRNSAEFRRVYERKCSVANDQLIVYGLPTDLEYPRIGLSVSRKVGNAVVRNRWKRLLREAFRLSRSQLPSQLDLVVIPRPGVTPELRLLQRSLQQLTGRLQRKLSRPAR